jgi:hypothetical protein
MTEWPPGIWRRIIIWPQRGWIGGALEDDVHRFHMRIDHDGGRITGVQAQALRHPWSACPGAAPHIAGELTGEWLADTAKRDPLKHCTHLYDLAVVLAAHAEDSAPTQFDLRVADRTDDRTQAVLLENGSEAMRWQLEGTEITGPAPFAGLDLRRLSSWKQDLPARQAERATMLRRAVFISGARLFNPPPGLLAADQGSQRMGACFNYQMPQAAQSTRMPDWLRNWQGSDEPLGGFDPETAFAAMGGVG